MNLTLGRLRTLAITVKANTKYAGRGLAGAAGTLYLTTVVPPTNVGGMTYTLTPTETDGSIVSYEFTYEGDLWDYVTETLSYEYGMDSTDIVGTDVYGYHVHYSHGAVCEGHVIGSVTRT